MRLSTVTIDGVDGSVWRVAGHGAGGDGVFLGVNPEGFYDLPVRTLWTKSAYRPGATPGGVRYEPADLVLKFLICPSPGQSWEAIEASFLRAFSYEKDCSIGVQTAESGLRVLRVRMLEAPIMGPTYDPHKDEFSEITLTLRAADPFWWGPLESQKVAASAESGSATVKLTNFGDRELWPVWEKSGTGRWTIPDASAGGTNQRRITMPSELNGVNYVVDTDPHVEQVSAPGYPGAWASMGVVRFINPIPANSEFSAQVSWSSSNTGSSLTLLTRSRYSRPWGV